MKKLIGIILALCMLGTMASAATIENPNATATLSTMTVSVTYTALANNAQATLFAYKVANDATLENAESIAYKNQTDTPIVGIDQEASDGTFDFKVDAAFRGKIAVKVGGADVTTPVTMLVEFADPVTPPVNPDPEPDEPETTTVEFVFGDVNKDGKADGTDANLIVGFAGGASGSVGGAYDIGATVPVINVIFGDVNKDGKADGTDANLIVGFAGGASGSVGGAYNIGATVTIEVPVAK